MDWVRSCYRTKVRFSPDPAAPAVEIQWFFVDDQPLTFLPLYTKFASGNWASDHTCPAAWKGPGEISPWFQDRKWVNGNRLTPVVCSGRPIGSAREFAGDILWPWTPLPEGSCCGPGGVYHGQLTKGLGIRSNVTYEPAGADCISCSPHATPLFMYVQGFWWSGSLRWGWDSSVLNGLVVRCKQVPGFPCGWNSDPILIPPFPGSGKPPFHVRFSVSFPAFTNTMTVAHRAIDPTFAFDGFWSETGSGLTCCPVNTLPLTGRFPPFTFMHFPADVSVACSPGLLPPPPPPPHHTVSSSLPKAISMDSLVIISRNFNVSSALAKTLSISSGTVRYGRRAVGSLPKSIRLSSVVNYVASPTFVASLRKTLGIRIDTLRYAPHLNATGSLRKKLSMSSVVTYP